jgi:hypothetical protein
MTIIDCDQRRLAEFGRSANVRVYDPPDPMPPRITNADQPRAAADPLR